MHLSLYEKIWFATFLGTGIALSIVWGDTITGFLAFFSGIVCVLLAAKGSRWNYPVGIVNCVSYSYISFLSGLFGEVMLNMMFYLPLQFVGFFMWSRKTKPDGIVKMRAMNYKAACAVALLAVIAVIAYSFYLDSFERQVTPVIDSFTTVFSITAAILMLKRYREFWVIYIVVNIVSVLMWAIRFANGTPDSLTMVVMWGAYFINSVYGAYVWFRLTGQAENEK